MHVCALPKGQGKTFAPQMTLFYTHQWPPHSTANIAHTTTNPHLVESCAHNNKTTTKTTKHSIGHTFSQASGTDPNPGEKIAY